MEEKKKKLEEARKLIQQIEDAKGDWFKTLGLELEDTTPDLVKSRFKNVVMLLHTDKLMPIVGDNQDLLQRGKAAFNEADKAYKSLKDPDVIARFRAAAQKQKEKEDFRKNNSVFERFFRQATGSTEGTTEEENRMATELSPEERAKFEAEKSRKEFLYRAERKHYEKQDRMERKVRQREDDLRKEAELQDTIGSWKSFSQGAKRRAMVPSLKPQTSSKSANEAGSSAPQMDYKLLRKSWQDYSRS